MLLYTDRLDNRCLPLPKNEDCYLLKDRRSKDFFRIFAYSYEYATGEKDVLSVDPHYSDTYYGEHWDPIGNISEDGSFKAGYEADKAGTNYVMIW